MTRRQQGLCFYAIALGLAFCIALLGPDAEGGVQILTMATPAVSVLVMLFVVTREGRRHAAWSALGLLTVGWRGWPWALGLPLAVVVGSYAAASLVSDVSWTLTPDLVAKALIGTVIVSALALFEEVGWRGYLLPRIAPVPGPGAAALVGLLHGVWHLPLILLTTAYLPGGTRWLTIPVFLLVLTGAGVVYGWLRESSGSLWPVVIAHGAFNAFVGTAAGAAAAADEVGFAYLTGETGLFTVLAVGVVAALLARHYPRQPSAEPDRPRTPAGASA